MKSGEEELGESNATARALTQTAQPTQRNCKVQFSFRHYPHIWERMYKCNIKKSGKKKGIQ